MANLNNTSLLSDCNYCWTSIIWCKYVEATCCMHL